VLKIGGDHHSEAVGLRERKRTENDGIKHAVDRGIGADAEAKRGQYYYGESGIFAELANGIAGVGGEGHH
jgi:hypothetical protein